jgi:uncharacterized membrane protein
MSRQQQHTRVVANKNQGAIEQQTIVDDNLLPSAEELAKLKEVDPSIIDWILQRSEKEQDTRLSFNMERLELAKSEHKLVKLSLWIAFVLAVIGMLMSIAFAYLGMEIIGTVFGGASIIMCVQSFLRFGRKEKQSNF